MRSFLPVISFITFLALTGCITEFYLHTDESQSLLVVQGLITDQPEKNVVKLSRSHSLDLKETSKPLKGCRVIIEDDQNVNYELKETDPGTYVTDPTVFQGVQGRKYILRIYEMNAAEIIASYESIPMEMKQVPPIDTLWYEKVVLSIDEYGSPEEGCKVFVSTADQNGSCRYFRWDFTETWEFKIPFDVDNSRCWVTNKSNTISIKNTSILTDNTISKQPVNFITNESDRLIIRYSMLVNQYSLTEDEFNFWEKLQNVTQEIGSLYDIIPAPVFGNIHSVADPNEKVLGYFSVSAKTSKRIFINEFFKGQPNYYTLGGCLERKVPRIPTPPGLNVSIWEVTWDRYQKPYEMWITSSKACVDCTVRGSKIKPDFWDEK